MFLAFNFTLEKFLRLCSIKRSLKLILNAATPENLHLIYLAAAQTLRRFTRIKILQEFPFFAGVNQVAFEPLPLPRFSEIC